MVEPRTVNAGDTWTWIRVLRDFPASAGWTLTYYLSKGAAAPKTIVCTAQGDDHLATVVPNSSGWDAGDYHWTARVKNAAGETHSLDSGVLVVRPDPSATVDRRTPNELALAAVEAVLAGNLSNPIVEYEIDGVKAKKISPAELNKLHGTLVGAVRRERGGPAVVPILVRFGRV